MTALAGPATYANFGFQLPAIRQCRQVALTLQLLSILTRDARSQPDGLLLRPQLDLAAAVFSGVENQVGHGAGRWLRTRRQCGWRLVMGCDV